MKKILSMLLLAASTFTVTAHASDPAELAKRHYRTGLEHFNGRRWTEARAAFASGYDLSRRPAFLLNMAECERELSHLEEAATLYRRYLLEDPKGSQRASAEGKLKELERQIAATPAKPAESATKSATPANPGAPIRPPLSPIAPRDAKKEAIARARPSIEEERAERPTWISVALGSAAGTGIAAGVGLELAAYFTASDLAEQACAGGEASCAEDLVAGTTRHNVFVGSGAAALGVGTLGLGGLITYLVWPETSSTAEGVAIVPWISEERIGGSVGASF